MHIAVYIVKNKGDNSSTYVVLSAVNFCNTKENPNLHSSRELYPGAMDAETPKSPWACKLRDRVRSAVLSIEIWSWQNS